MKTKTNLEKLQTLINKNRIHFFREGKKLIISFDDYDRASSFCSLLNQIGDENLDRKKG